MSKKLCHLLYNELLSSKNHHDDNFDEIYSKLKDIIKRNPELKSKVDDIYDKELRKLRKAL